MDATFWALIALLIFLAVVFRAKLPSAIAAKLDHRAERIRKDLDDARRLREEAQALLAEYEAKRREAGSFSRANQAKGRPPWVRWCGSERDRRRGAAKSS